MGDWILREGGESLLGRLLLQIVQSSIPIKS